MNENEISQNEPLPVPIEPEASQPGPPPEVEKPKKRSSFLVQALRWLLIVLILFGLGSILILFALYIPARNDLNNARQSIDQISRQSKADLEEANQEIERLSGLEEKNKALEKELGQANLRVTLLQVRTDVLTAQLALINGEPEKALLALSTTPETLDKLADLLPAEHSDFIQTLQKRLELTREGIENGDSAAESDLNVMIIKLLELEDALIR